MEARAGAPQSPDPWRAWIREVGAQVRRVREFLGFSQEQLGRLAGVSQGAISRLEGGRGLQTPLLVVMKLHIALVERLREVDPALLNEDLRRLIESEIYPPMTPGAQTAPPVTGDLAADELVRLYRTLPPSQRETFRSVVRAAAQALAAGPRGA